MTECQNTIEVKEVYIPPWSEYVAGMHTVFGDYEDQYRIQYTPDVIYCEKNKKLHLQLFTHWTPAIGKKYPLLIHIRGSGWKQQDIYGFLPQLTELARCGYIVASIEYRTIDDGFGFPAQVEDTKTAIHYLMDNADKYGIDTSRIAILGDSSGGHTALLTAYSGKGQLCEKADEDIDFSIKCVIDFFGPTDFTSSDLTEYPCGIDNTLIDSPFNVLLNSAIYKYDDVKKAASPVSYVSNEKVLPATLIIHGDRDNLVPFPQSVRLYNKLRESSQEVDFYMIRNAAHGAKIWTEQVMEIVKCFLAAHI